MQKKYTLAEEDDRESLGPGEDCTGSTFQVSAGGVIEDPSQAGGPCSGNGKATIPLHGRGQMV